MAPMLRPNKLSSLLFAVFALLLAGLANALPTPGSQFHNDLMRRQNNTANIPAPTTLHTVNTADTPVGSLTTTCVVTLTPITDNNGQPAIQEVRTCTLSYDNSTNSSNNNSGSSSSNSGSSGNSASSTSTTDSSSSLSTDSSSATSTSSGLSTDSSTATSTSSDGSSSTFTAPALATGNPAVSVNGVSQIPASQITSLTGSASAAAASSTSAGSGSSSSSSSTTSTTASAGAANAADNAPSSSGSAPSASGTTQTTFTLPGRKLSVLPIGLGVFAGISVIALIVVGLVTYERTKYRKAFRERKLAEAGASMGYGGMAQRT